MPQLSCLAGYRWAQRLDSVAGTGLDWVDTHPGLEKAIPLQYVGEELSLWQTNLTSC